MSLEEKFNAAVNVIRSLPKSGSYQPSNELMLRFYSYFKQASEGPCDKPKPGFWDVVNRAKWEAWNKLGNMTKNEAMKAYVEELHKIVETMSYSSDVASFLSVDDDDQGFVNSDLELVAGDVLARVRSEHNSPSGSQSASGASSPIRSGSPPRARHDSEDEYIDTVDVSISDPEVAVQPRTAPRLSNGHAHQITSQLTHLKVLEQLPGTLARLEADVAALRKAVEGDRRILDQVSRGWRWPWQELSPPTLILLLAWPLIVYRFTRRSERYTIISFLAKTTALKSEQLFRSYKATDTLKPQTYNTSLVEQVSRGWRWPWQELSPPTLILLLAWPLIVYRFTRRTERYTS